jgi:hypothetical protein
MTEHTPYIDFENLPTPAEGFLVTQFITVRSVARSRAFYSDVLGGQVVQWHAKGAEFVTPPIHRGAEIRCYMRDPDGYMIEVGRPPGYSEGDSPRSGRKICPANFDRRRMRSVGPGNQIRQLCL